MLSSSNKIPFQYFARTLPNIKTGHDWHWNVEGHHTAQDWHELVSFDELDEAHPFVQIRFALNVRPGVDGGDPDDLAKGKLLLKKDAKAKKKIDRGKSPGGEDHQSRYLRRSSSSVRERACDREVPWKLSPEMYLVFILHLFLVVVILAVVSVTICNCGK